MAAPVAAAPLDKVSVRLGWVMKGEYAFLVVGKETGNHAVINAYTLSPLAFHIDDVFRCLILGRSPLTLLGVCRDEQQERRGFDR